MKVAGEVTQTRSKASDPNGVEPMYSCKTHFLRGGGSCDDRSGKLKTFILCRLQKLHIV